MYITVRNIFMQYISLILYRDSLIEVELIKIMIYLFMLIVIYLFSVFAL